MADYTDDLSDDIADDAPATEPVEGPLTASEFREILSSVTAQAAPVDDTVDDDDDVSDGLDDYTPEGIAARAAPIATQAATRAVIAQMNAITSFKAQVRAAAAKSLGDYDIPPEMIESTLDDIVTAYPDPASLKQILDSKSYQPMLYSKVGELALQGKLKKTPLPQIDQMTPTSATATSTVEQRAEAFRQAFKREPSKVMQEKWRGESR